MARSPWPASQRLGRAFFARPVAVVAADLVGRDLVALGRGGLLAVRLLEVEAYGGVGEDPASHAHRGPTARNREMFATPGRLYVYFTYGMHHCMNVVCEAEGVAGAVLLRAGRPLAGEARMQERRGRGGRDLVNGPAKLCQAFAIDLAWNGTDLVTGPLGLWPGAPPPRVARSGRVGIRQGRQLPLRFFDPRSDSIARRRP
jgi:DNA-3-methyladenine glycosylase